MQLMSVRDSGEARVEVVDLTRRVDGEFLGFHITGTVDDGEEYRIHVPEGSLEKAGLCKSTNLRR